jgi:hypothetical protein
MYRSKNYENQKFHSIKQAIVQKSLTCLLFLQSTWNHLQYKKEGKKGKACRPRWRDREDEVTYTRGDRGTCCGQGWGFGPSAPSVRRTAGMATAGDGKAATATATGRAASPENLAPPRRLKQADPAGDQTIGEVWWGRGGSRVGWSRRRRTGWWGWQFSRSALA